MHDLCLGKSKESFGTSWVTAKMKNEDEKAKWMNERIEKGYSFRYCKNSDGLNVSVLCVETKEEFFFNWGDDVLKGAKNTQQQVQADSAEKPHNRKRLHG